MSYAIKKQQSARMLEMNREKKSRNQLEGKEVPTKTMPGFLDHVVGSLTTNCQSFENSPAAAFQ